MKYILVIWVCSFINNSGCMEPITYDQLYGSWYECSIAAHRESRMILQKMGYKWVNQFHVGMKYSCKLTETL